MSVGRLTRSIALVLLRAQLQVDRGEVVAQLFFGARADDEARDCRPPEQPGQCDLSRGHAVLFSDLDERIDGVPELVLVVDRRRVQVDGVPGALRRRVVTAVLAREQAAGLRTPDEQAQSLVERRGDDLVLGERSYSDRYTCWLTKAGNPSARAMRSAFMTCQQ